MIRCIFFAIVIAIFISCAVKKEMIELPEKEELPEINNYLWAYKSSVNIRQTTSSTSKKIGQLSDGDSVIVVSNENGWYKVVTDTLEGFIRSDLLGPRNLSTFRRAFNYANYLKKHEQIELYFDKKLYHRRIFISLPPSDYISQEIVDKKVEQVLATYQKEVYWGQVTAVVLKPGTKEEYSKIAKAGRANAEVTLPILPFGQLKDVQHDGNDGISLTILTPMSVIDQALLATSKSIVQIYPITYKSVELIFISGTSNGEDECRLWFREDSNGATHKFNHCPPTIN